MAPLLLSAIILTVILLFASGLFSSKAGYIRLPFLLSLIYLIWFIPQARLIVFRESVVPSFGNNVLLLMALLSIIAANLGWIVALRNSCHYYPCKFDQKSRTPLFNSLRKVKIKHLLIITKIFVLTALAIQILIQIQPASALTARQPSGFITILRFFTAINPIALFLALALYMNRKSRISLALLFLATLTYAPGVLLGFKRTEITEFGVIILFCFWSVLGRRMPRVAIPLIFIFGLIVIFGVNEIRPRIGYSIDGAGQVQRVFPSLSELAKIDWTKSILENASSRAFEYSNGVYFIDEIARSGFFGAGRILWNSMIQSWVPGQFVGSDFKRSLLFEAPGLNASLERYGVEWRTGTTSTGFPEVYQDWNLFGVILFFIMGWITGRAYKCGLSGDLASAATYPVLATLCLSSFTHGGYLFFQVLPIILTSTFVIRRFFYSHMPKRYVVLKIPYQPNHCNST